MGAFLIILTSIAFGAAYDNPWLGLGIGSAVVLALTLLVALFDEDEDK